MNHDIIQPHSSAAIELLSKQLPPSRINLNVRQYGAYQLLEKYCNLRVKLSHAAVEWQHGWHPPSHNIHPELVVGNDGFSGHLAETCLHLVARKDQQEYLANQGYQKVEAVGLPILYVPLKDVVRIPHSLLVMPIHSLEGVSLSASFNEYAEMIYSLRSKFDKIVVCVSSHCIRNGYWVKEFEERGIEVIEGANYNDANALHRVATLLSSFEYMTTNGLGSHITYGAHFGQKVSIHGKLEDYSEEN